MLNQRLIDGDEKARREHHVTTAIVVGAVAIAISSVCSFACWWSHLRFIKPIVKQAEDPVDAAARLIGAYPKAPPQFLRGESQPPCNAGG